MISEARRKANDKYIANNYARISLSVKKETKKQWEDYAKANNESLNGLIKKAVEKYINEK